MPFATTWVNLEDITLSEIARHWNKNTACSHLYLEFKQFELIKPEKRIVVKTVQILSHYCVALIDLFNFFVP